MRFFFDLNLKLGQILLEHRWLFIVLLSAFAFIFESSEVFLGLEEIDAQYYREVIFFVLIYPVFVGWLLSVLLKVQTERNEALQQQKFIEDMLAVPSWDLLLETIAAIPRRIAPVVAVGLFLQSRENENYSLAAEWSLLHPDVRFSLKGIDPFQSCGGGNEHPGEELHPFPNHTENSSLRGYCLPLYHGAHLLGLLHIYTSRKDTLTAEQVRMFNGLAGSIASTIESATPEDADSVRVAVARLERERLARLLHDTLGQSLSYLRSVLEQFNMDELYSRITSIQHDLDRMRDISNDAYEQIRQTLRSLQPQYEGNLSDTLHTIASKTAERAGFELQYRVRGAKRQLLPADVQRKILLILREAINNIEQHAQAKVVNLSLLWEDPDLVITIEDDGVGFDPNAVSAFGHFGIQIMNQRIKEISGWMELASAPGQGSRIVLHCPLNIEHALVVE
ncbi:MAG TPA: ATP-binding protein [Anaerolineales bacterium]|nr:ATP-binding protein [Anaerolineales bacterium]